jgi:pimeloyl-ACP methyl ester carboxylesterase
MTNKSQWIFLRGLARESGHWQDFPQRFETYFPRRQVDCLDLPGTGVLFKENSPTSIAGITDSIRKRAPTPSGRTYLLSISLGSMVAIDWVCRYPDDFRGVVLINPSFSKLSPFYRRLKWQVWPKALRAILARGARRETAILALTTNLLSDPQRIVEDFTRLQNSRPIRLENSLRQLWAAFRFIPAANLPPIPVLLLNSKQDRLVDSQCSQVAAARWSLPLKTHATAGHDLPLDDPQWILDQINEVFPQSLDLPTS